MEYAYSTRMSAMKPTAIRELMKYFTGTDCILFASGNPSAESFPLEDIRRISADVLKNQANEVLQYGITEGYLPLRELLKKRMKEKYRCGTDSDDLVVTSGSQQVIDLTCRALVNEGDTIVCDSPSYMGALNIFRSYRANLAGVDMEPDGIDIEKLEKTFRAEKNVKLLYLIPTFQNPTGISLSAEKRKAVYELCKKYGVVILEDNPYGDLRYRGEDILPLKSLDTDGIVVYGGSFSKILSAGIRVGYALAPRELAQKIVIGKQVSDVHTNTFFQVLAERYMTLCDLDRHIEQIRGLYRRKSALMVSAVRRELPECTFQEPEGGLFLWCTLPPEVPMAEYCGRAAKNGVAIVPGTAFTIRPEDPCNSFRLNYSTPTDEQIVQGVKILGDTLRSFQ